MDSKAFELYKVYVAIQRHFSSNYSYRKYHGKLKLKYSTFEKNNTKSFFYMLANKKVKKEQLIDMLACVQINKGKLFIADITNQETVRAYKELNQYKLNDTYQLEKTIGQLLTLLQKEKKTFKDLFYKNPEDNYHRLIQLYKSGKIHWYFILQINSFTGCLDIFMRENNNIAWEEEYKLLKNLNELYTFDSAKLLLLSRNKIKNFI